MQRQIPVIYFLGTSPGRYQPIIPTFIVGWYPERLRVQLAFGAISRGLRSSCLASGSRASLCASRGQGTVAAPDILPRCRPDRLRGTVYDLASTRAAAPRCRSHRHGCGRGVRAADCLQWPAAIS
jgi:hypothetical protein